LLATGDDFGAFCLDQERGFEDSGRQGSFVAQEWSFHFLKAVLQSVKEVDSDVSAHG